MGPVRARVFASASPWILVPAMQPCPIRGEGGSMPVRNVRQSLRADERLRMRDVMSVLDAFGPSWAAMPLQYVYTFLLVACEEGLSASEYAQRLGASPSAVERHL